MTITNQSLLHNYTMIRFSNVHNCILYSNFLCYNARSFSTINSHSSMYPRLLLRALLRLDNRSNVSKTRKCGSSNCVTSLGLVLGQRQVVPNSDEGYRTWTVPTIQFTAPYAPVQLRYTRRALSAPLTVTSDSAAKS